MAEDLLGFSADGPGFLGICSRISRQMAKNLSVFLVDGPGFVSKWPRIPWHFGGIVQPAFLVKLGIS